MACQLPSFVLVDDMGHDDVGCFGSPDIKTPHIDQLAREGTRFTSFYAQNVCGPSRAAILTGTYPIRIAEPGNAKHPHTILHPGEITLAEHLRAAGYATACIGKWHLGGDGAGEHGRGTGPFVEARMPNAQGFDYFNGTPLHNDFTRTPTTDWHTELYRNTTLLTRDAKDDELTGNHTCETIEFIRRHKERPFFCYLAYSMVHVVLGAGEGFRGSSARGIYGDAIQEIDDGVGRIIATLEDLKIDANAVIVFTPDNGPWIESQLGDHGGSGHPLRGMKMTTWEGGVRVPGIVRWPGRVPAGRVTDQICTTLDVFATFSQLAGVALQSDRTLDSLDMSRFWLGETERSPRDTFFFYAFTHLQAVRQGPWKLVRPRPAQPPWTSWYARMIDGVADYEIYNLDADIGELNNIAAQHPDIVAKLTSRLDTARVELGDYDVVGSTARFFDANPPAPGDARDHPTRLSKGVPVATKLSTGANTITFTYASAIAPEPGVARRDPSDVIQVGDTFYVWYTKITDGEDVESAPFGYSGDVYCATSKDGHSFTEQGIAIAKGCRSEWDAHGVFTPNILVWKGRYWLYYTGVRRPFDATTPTQIGLAVADSPTGPWTRHRGNPVLKPDAGNPSAFDSMHVEDAALVVRDQTFWLYYKGHCLEHGRSAPKRTRMGVAMAKSPDGPFVRSASNPMLEAHEVLVWPQSFGVGSLATATETSQIQYAWDGVKFAPRNPVQHPRAALGIFRLDGFVNDAIVEVPTWGISMRQAGRDMFREQFDIHY